MQTLGYNCRGENGMPFRCFFHRENGIQAYNIHIWEENNAEVSRHLKFRNYLLNHPEARDAYADLKKTLAQKYPNDILSYCLSKSDFVQDIDCKAGYDGLRMVEALSDQEWGGYWRIRNSQIIAFSKTEDLHTQVLKVPEHRHLVLIKGNTIIGCAHIHLQPLNYANLNVIAIDSPYQRKGFGRQFLSWIERWLKHQNFQSLRVQSSQEIYSFYKKLGYVEMPSNGPDAYPAYSRDISIGKIL